MIRGFDWASYQGSFDAERASRDGYAFAIGKATQGTSYVNPTHASQSAKVRASGMLAGHYHYAEFGNPVAESDHFLRQLGALTPGEFVALDAEDTAGVDLGNRDLYPFAKRFGDAVYLQLGIKPLLYSNQSFIELHNLGGLAGEGWGLWLAAWQAPDPSPVPNWPFVAFWQYDARGMVDGIDGDVDLDRFNGSLARLHLYGVK